MNKLHLVLGCLCVSLGVYGFLAKPAAPKLAGAGAPMSTETAAANARTQRRSSLSIALLGACFVVDAFQFVGPSFRELGLVFFFAAGAWEYRLDTRRLRESGAAPKRLGARRFFAGVSDVAAAFFLIAFAAQFFPGV
jgi:hypothetical protein